MKISYLLDILQLIYPKICYSCNNVLIKNERILCLKCYLSIPKHRGDALKYIYVEGKEYKVHSLYSYRKKGTVQLLIHQLKYKQKKHIGVYMGELLYPLLKHLKGVNYIIPVPLNKKKEKLRGYNQSEMIANGLTKLLGCKIITSALIRHENKQSQTLKTRYKRFEEIEGVFSLNEKHMLENKHVLLLDDVYTTGATIKECIKTLKRIKNIKISIASVAS